MYLWVHKCLNPALYCNDPSRCSDLWHISPLLCSYAVVFYLHNTKWSKLRKRRTKEGYRMWDLKPTQEFDCSERLPETLSSHFLQ